MAEPHECDGNNQTPQQLQAVYNGVAWLVLLVFGLWTLKGRPFRCSVKVAVFHSGFVGVLFCGP